MDFNFNLIVAMSINGCIGYENKIPWYLPEDLPNFKKLTMNSIVIMGRKTFESLPNGPLKNRLNIVITRNAEMTSLNDENVIITNYNDIFLIIEKFKKENQKIFIIGGSDIYNLFINHCKKLYITYVLDNNINGDTWFNKELINNYNIISSSDILTSKTGIEYKFLIFEKD